MKLQAELEKYLAVREAEGLKQTTIANYRTHVGVLLSWLGERDLTPETFARFFVEYRAGHAVASCVSVFNASTIWLKSVGEIGRIGTMRRPRGETPPKATYTEDQLTALFKVLRADRSKLGLRDYAVVSLLRYCGLRASEVCRLTLDDIDDGVITITTGKSVASKRVIPLIDSSTRAVAAWLARARPKLNPATDRLFCGQTGEPMTRTTIRMMLRRRSEVVGFHLSAHRFRHTWCTTHVSAGTSAAIIGRLAGWSPKTLTVMLLNYAHPDVSVLARAQVDAFS